jgi:hypothetical protein
LETLRPRAEYWDFELLEDEKSFEYILYHFFPYDADTNFDEFCCRERHSIHLEANFIPCFCGAEPDLPSFPELFPEYCLSCNTSVRKRIEEMLDDLLDRYDPVAHILEDFRRTLTPKQIEEYRRSVNYMVSFCETHPDILEEFGDPCGLGRETRKVIRELMESKYYGFVCESQKLRLLAGTQSPIERILLQELLSRGLFQDSFNALNRSISVSTQAGIYEDGYSDAYYRENQAYFGANPDYLPDFLKGKVLFTIADIFIQAKNKPHPGPRPRDESEVPQWKEKMEAWPNVRKLAIYADGHDYHEKTRAQARRDRSIDRRLQSLGYVVYRFTGSEIHRDVRSCCDFIQHDIDKFMNEATSKNGG